MNREDVIRMAKDAGIERCSCKSSTCAMLRSNTTFTHLERFAALVAAAAAAEEREECAQLAEACDDKSIALFIRARGNT